MKVGPEPKTYPSGHASRIRVKLSLDYRATLICHRTRTAGRHVATVEPCKLIVHGRVRPSTTNRWKPSEINNSCFPRPRAGHEDSPETVVAATDTTAVRIVHTCGDLSVSGNLSHNATSR